MKKRTILLVTIILIALSCSENKTQTPGNLNWTTDLGKAIEKAKTEQKAVLVNFTGSDWCKWCFKLRDEVFSKAEFKKYADENLILVEVDFPQNKPQSNETRMYNYSLQQKFGVQGYPTIIIINKDGKPVAKTGYQPGGPQNYINHIKSYLGS